MKLDNPKPKNSQRLFLSDIPAKSNNVAARKAKMLIPESCCELPSYCQLISYFKSVKIENNIETNLRTRKGSLCLIPHHDERSQGGTPDTGNGEELNDSTSIAPQADFLPVFLWL